MPFLGKRFKYDPSYRRRSMSLLALESKIRVQEKIKNLFYKYEDCDCFCGSKDSVLLSDMDRYGIYYPFVICKNCGIMRANPRMTEGSYIDFYAYEYRQLYGDNDIDKEELYKTRVNQAQEVHDFITTLITLPRNAVVFDIGCNMGTMLLPFYQGGCEVMGVDYGLEYIEYGKKKTGLKLEIGGSELLKEFGKKADLIILNHVFEHFLNIDEELKQVRDILKPDAYIYISPWNFLVD